MMEGFKHINNDVVFNRIVLDAGYFLDNRSFFENFFSISIYAVIVSGSHYILS